MSKRALITGITGQDGYYMAELLFKNGYDVHGIVRPSCQFDERLGPILNDISLHCIDLLDKSDVTHLIDSLKPDEIYNFAAVSNVFNPWENISETFDINIKIPQYILEAIIDRSRDTKFLQASSSLVFGRNMSGLQNESTPRNPIYPYGVSKNMVDDLINEAKRTYDIKACSAIFFNHESPRRGDNFFSKKIAKAVVDIKNKKLNMLPIGNLNPYRDYGYAVDYMEAAHLMLQEDDPQNYIVGTGELTVLSDYVKKCFNYVGLDMYNHIYVDHELYRENDTSILKADITKIKNDLGWSPKTDIYGLVKIMMDSALENTNY